MSAKRSFDVQRRPAKPIARAKKSSKRRRSASTPRRTPTLRERRFAKERRNFLLIIVGILIVLGGTVYLLWRPEIRISKIEAVGANDTASLEAIAAKTLEGKYHHIFPRDSFFFYPEKEIRAAIISEHPEISAISVSRTGFTSMRLKAVSRLSAFWWCGTPDQAKFVSGSCYETDVEGLVFKAAITDGALESSTTQPTLKVYADIDSSTVTTYPLRARVMGAEKLPDILLFARAIKSLGIPIRSVGIRGDEADLFTEGGTRITYVVGHEKPAAENAKASFSNLNLLDGSVEYVDLRFDGKVYLKRVGE